MALTPILHPPPGSPERRAVPRESVAFGKYVTSRSTPGTTGGHANYELLRITRQGREDHPKVPLLCLCGALWRSGAPHPPHRAENLLQRGKLVHYLVSAQACRLFDTRRV